MQLCANITITVGFISLIFLVTYYFIFMLEILQQKNAEKIPSHYFVVPGASFCIAGRFEGSTDCC